MYNDKTPYLNVIEGRSARGWTVSIAQNGANLFMAVFRAERDAQNFADTERRKVGLRPIYADI
jgi:hypothetical protein